MIDLKNPSYWLTKHWSTAILADHSPALLERTSWSARKPQWRKKDITFTFPFTKIVKVPRKALSGFFRKESLFFSKKLVSCPSFQGGRLPDSLSLVSIARFSLQSFCWLDVRGVHFLRRIKDNVHKTSRSPGWTWVHFVAGSEPAWQVLHWRSIAGERRRRSCWVVAADYKVRSSTVSSRVKETALERQRQPTEKDMGRRPAAAV